MKGINNIAPQQVAAGVAAEGGVLLVRDSSNSYYELNLEGLNSMMIPGEWYWTTDVVSGLNAGFTRTIPIALAAITVYTDTITVPAGEVWIIESICCTTPVVDATGVASWNFGWPGMSTLTTGGYFDVARRLGTAATGALGAGTEFINVATGEARDTIDVFVAANILRANGLGTQLRLVGPLVLTFTTTTTVVAWTAAYTYAIFLRGRKVNKVTS